MNDDLNLVLSYLSTSGSLTKVYIRVEHGMNSKEWKDIPRDGELNEDLLPFFEKHLPLFVFNHICSLVSIESVFTMVYVPYEEN